MHTAQVTLPNQVVADLFHVHDYPGGPFDYIQLARANSLFLKPAEQHAKEETYWRDLEILRTQFADQIPDNFDLIIDPPSNSGWHRPFVSAVRRRFPNINCISFIKEVNNTSLKAFQDVVRGLAQATKILIVDDVFFHW